MRRWGLSNILPSAASIPRPPSTTFFTDGVLNSSSVNVDFVSNPDAWEREFFDHMTRLQELLLQKNPDYDTIQDVFFTFNVMTHLLMLEVNSQPKTTIGTILDSCFSNEIFIKLQSWAEGVSESYHMACQVNLLKAYDSMLSNSNRHSHCVLVHKPILLPLLRLLHWCNETVEERNHVPCGIDKDFVVLLNQISRKMSQDITLLHFLFNFNEDTSDGDGENNVEAMNTSFGSFKSTNSNSSSNRFLVFSLLIPYLYGPGDIGQLAKDSVLSILAVSAKFRAVASYITKKTSFCQVLSGGLCALYSLLPRHIGAALQVSQNWHKLIIPNDILLLPSLTDLHDSLIFLNAIVEVSHPMIKMEIVSNFYKGLLVEVMKPGFIQGDSDEFLSQIVYLNLMFETFTDE
uniref:UPF0518 protein n=1 Tax=Strongyloides papillosus TaxID=174720 RepID=A0A0N5B3V9_STREA